jgi:hypothetical protein
VKQVGFRARLFLILLGFALIPTIVLAAAWELTVVRGSSRLAKFPQTLAIVLHHLLVSLQPKLPERHFLNPARLRIHQAQVPVSGRIQLFRREDLHRADLEPPCHQRAPPVWLSLVFSYVFGRKLHWFPLAGYCDLTYDPESTNQCGGPRYWAYHMFLPWLTFAMMFTALYARMIRANLLEVMHEDYVRTAVAKGAGSFRVLRHHVLRNALLSVITMIGMDIGVAFGGAIFIEEIFELPGMGHLLVLSIASVDLPTILGIVLTVSIVVVLANLIVDIAYPLLDPRVRLSGKGDAIAASRGMRRQLGAQRHEATESAG